MGLLVWSNRRYSDAVLLSILVYNIAFDLLDYAIIGSIPGLGDIIDVFVTGVNFILLGPIALIGVVELVPVVGDLLPTYTAIALAAIIQLKRHHR